MSSRGVASKKIKKLNYRGTSDRFFISKFSKIIKNDFSKKYSKIIYFTAKKVIQKPSNIQNLVIYRYDGGKIEIHTISNNCDVLGKIVDSCREF